MPKHSRAEIAEKDVETVYIRIDGVEVRVDMCGYHRSAVRAAYEAGTRVTPQAGDLPANTRAAIERRFRNG
jgi:hypothetical protein